MTQSKHIVVAPGDGIGPEIMEATLEVLQASGAPLTWDTIKLGKEVYESGNSSGVPAEAWDHIRKSGVLLKSPLTTPQGKGFKSVNVTIRKSLNLYANVRPCKSYTPFISSPHHGMNLVIIRENEEDLYAGIEHQQTPEVTQVLKLISRPGCERIIRYAFEYAKSHGRSKVTCMTKDNIMKLTDGLFHRVFDEIAADYPNLETEHQIIDIGSAKLAASPEMFDVIVTLNLYGDIISDIAAQIAGSVGLASSANVGEDFSMFEAVHGSAPDIAGKGIANPSGLLLAAAQMLVHLGLPDHATKVTNALLTTLEDGIHTGDIFDERRSKQRVGTKDFTKAIIERLGQSPKELEAVHYQKSEIKTSYTPRPVKKTLVGVDIFVCWDEQERDPEALAKLLREVETDELSLRLITNRGVKVFPEGMKETFCTDHWRCRFRSENENISYQQVITLMERIHVAGLDIIKSENLCFFDGSPGFSMGQGE